MQYDVQGHQLCPLREDDIPIKTPPVPGVVPHDSKKMCPGRSDCSLPTSAATPCSSCSATTSYLPRSPHTTECLARALFWLPPTERNRAWQFHVATDICQQNWCHQGGTEGAARAARARSHLLLVAPATASLAIASAAALPIPNFVRFS